MLTNEQKRAARHLWENREKEVLHLVAGAGSGKTSTLIASLECARDSDFDLSLVALITFTRKSAFEMKERAAHKNIKPGYIGTMHALGYSIIKKYFGQQKIKLIHNTRPVVSKIIADNFPDYKFIRSDIRGDASILKDEDKAIFAQLYHQYKKENSIFDMDDLITVAAKIITRNIKINPYRYILIDEFQDTSPEQLSLIKAMDPQKLFAVGDDWQSIYKFRGADVTITLEMDTHFRQLQRLFLTSNFRSQKKIVTLGNKAIKLSSSFIPKKLKTTVKGSLSPVCYVANCDGDIEAIWKAYVENVLSKKKKKLTILVRTNHIRLQLQNYTNNEIEILTIHSAKGLEFDHLLIFGIARNIFPHKWNDYDEEVRLFYVAITRAKKSLDFICWEKENKYSAFMPFLAKNCKVKYLNLKAPGHAASPNL